MINMIKWINKRQRRKIVYLYLTIQITNDNFYFNIRKIKLKIKRVLNKKKANELSVHSLPLSFSQYFALLFINKRNNLRIICLFLLSLKEKTKRVQKMLASTKKTKEKEQFTISSIFKLSVLLALTNDKSTLSIDELSIAREFLLCHSNHQSQLLFIV